MESIMEQKQSERVWRALDRFVVELPSWGFANTGTRFGKFIQAAAATSTEEKLADAGQVHKFTGCCPTVAVHVLWDFPNGIADIPAAMKKAKDAGVQIGAINPNVFQDQIYKYGSLGNPDPAVRQTALPHLLESAEIGKQTGSRDISLWFADGSNYPGTANIRHRKQWFAEGLRELHRHMSPLAAHARRIQAVRAGVLSHRYRRLGHVLLLCARRRGRRPRCWWTPAITTRRRTSSRSWPGCSPRTCSAGSTSMTGAMRTTT